LALDWRRSLYFEAMKRKRNVEQGYRDELGVFHPIRASKDYNEFLTTDVASPKERRERAEEHRIRVRRAELKGLERKHRTGQKQSGKSLASWVRSMGGIKPTEDLSGEVRRLSRKETGSTGLVSRKAGWQNTPEYLREKAVEAGYGDWTTPSGFLAAVEADARGQRKIYSMANPATKKNRAARRQRETPLFTMFTEAAAKAKPVTPIRRKVKRSDTGTEGKILSQKGDWYRVQYAGYDRPHWSHRSDLVFMNPKSKKVRLRKSGRKYLAIPKKANGFFGRVVAKKRLRRARRRAAVAAVDAQMATEDLKAARRKKRRNPNTRAANPVITPAKAKQLLKLNVGNRPVDSRKVNGIASVMKKGIFKRRKPIVFTNGILTDGQHTLLAIVKSGVSVPLKVSNKTLKKSNPPLLSDILGGLAGGAGYAYASHLTQKALAKRKKKNPTNVSALAVNERHLRELIKKYGKKDWTVKDQQRVLRDLQAVAARKSIKRHAKKAKKNPPPHGVGSLHQEFQGRRSSKFDVLDTPPGTPKNLAQLGVLKEIVLANGTPVNFTSPKARLCADGRGNLHVAGVRYKDNPTVDLGLVDYVTYDTHKDHLHNGKRFYFEHELGEEGGRRPRLLIKNGFPIFKGGDYKIDWAGIRN
jgi:hypothetical protein